MTVTINISPDVESRLAERAASSGLAVPEYVQQLVRKDSKTPKAYDPAAVLAVLDSFMEQDAQEQRETMEVLRKAIDEDRPGQRSIFGTGINPMPEDHAAPQSEP